MSTQAQVLAANTHVVSDSEEIRQALEAVSGEAGVAEVQEAAKLMDAAAEVPAEKPAEVAGDLATAIVENAAETKPEEPPAVEEKAAEPSKYKTWEAVKAAEKRNRALREQIRQEKAALDAERKELEAQRGQFKQQHDELINEPLEALKKRGVSFEDMARRVLADGKVSPEEAIKRLAVEMQEKISTLEKRDEEREQRVAAREQQQYIADYRSKVSAALATPEFELLSAYPDAEEEVFQLATFWAQQKQEVLTPQQAAAMIQDELKDRLSKLKSHKAARAFLGVPEEDEAAASSPGVSSTPKRATSPRTLTNKHAVAPAKTSSDDEFVSDAEEIRRAAKLIGPDAWKGISG